MAQKKFYIRTYGCQMNVYDSERMGETLESAGYRATDRADDADLILLNTCHIREKAAEKVYSELGRLAPLKARNPGLKLAVAGCVAQAEGAEVQRRQPAVDIVVGPQALHRLGDLAARAEHGERVCDTDFPAEDKFDHLPDRAVQRGSPTAFLTVQEGCDKFCAFCVVPYTRGAEVSRPVGRVLAEAEALVARGAAEITLLGQNVNAYHGDGPDGRVWSLARLIFGLADISGLERIRFTTSHPRDMSDDLVAAFRDCEKLMPFLHLPVQSGSDRILKAMNRGHSAADYLDWIDRLRAARPDIALSGDFITGFPGETEADFALTQDLVKRVGYAQAYSFCYSARPGTPAAGRAAVPGDIARERLYRLQSVLEQQQASFLAGLVGRQIPVLFEKPGREPGQIVGRSPWSQPVHVVADPGLIGQIVKVAIHERSGHSLYGML